MELKGNLIAVREDIRVLDATLRDGGLCNDFFFTDDFVRALYEMNCQSGVDYMEFGYRASTKLFDPSKFGKWKFSRDEDIFDIMGDNKEGPKISVMADVGRCDYKLIPPKSESPVDMIRVATYIDTIPEAIAMIDDMSNKGYETTVNIMAVSRCQQDEVRIALEMLAEAPASAYYIVDSYGSLYPEQIRRICDFYSEIITKYPEKRLGIHAHNNQQCAFANTIEAISIGVSYIDGTVCGMGRGAGNCSLEALMGFLKNPRYRINPVLSFIEKEMLPLRASGVKWGYDIPYLLTGLLDQHPRTAIAAIKNGDTKYGDFYQMLLD